MSKPVTIKTDIKKLYAIPRMIKGNSERIPIKTIPDLLHIGYIKIYKGGNSNGYK